MSSESIRYECPPTCPKVKEYLRAKIKKKPWLSDGIFPRKNNAYPLPDVPRIRNAEFREIPEEVIDVVNTKPINYYEKIEEVPLKVIEDIVKVTPTPEEAVIKEKEIVYEEPWLLNEIPPKKNDIYLPSPDVIEEIKEIQEEIIDVVPEKIEEIPEVIEDIVEVTPIPEEIVVRENEISREIQEKEIIRKEPWLLNEIPPEKNEVYPSPDVFREIQEEVIDVVNKKPIVYNEKIEEIPSKDIVEVTPIPEKAVIEETKIVIDVVNKKPIVYNEKIEEIPSNEIVEVTPIPEKAVIEETKIVIDVVNKKPIVYNEKIEEIPSNEIVEVTPIPEKAVIEETKIVIDVVDKKPIDYNEKIEEIPSNKIVEVTPIPEKAVIEEPKIVIDVVDKKPIDYNEKIEEIPSNKIVEVTPIPEKAVIEETKIVIDVVDKKPIDYNEKIEEIPSNKIVEVTPIPEKAVIEEIKIVPELAERIVNKKIDLVEEEIQEDAIIQEEVAIPMERIANYEEKIDLIKKKELVNEITVAEPVKEIPVEKPEIIEPEIERAAEIEPELPEELEEYFEPEKRVEYENEEGITDYERFIAEELREALPAVRKNEIPEKPREMPPEIPRNAVCEEIDRNAARPSREPEERRIISRKPKIAEVCDETCPFVKEQKERFMRKLKERQRVIDHYYLTKGFNYFEDVCTCSLACMVYALSRDPFVRSVFASLALFAVGLKLCSELDAWEMPNRVS